MKRRDSWSTEEWIHELDNVISMGRGWLGGLPPRSEGEIPSANAAKQLAEEACEFASCISATCMLELSCEWANLWGRLEGRVGSYRVSRVRTLGCTDGQFDTPLATLVAPNGYMGSGPAFTSVEDTEVGTSGRFRRLEHDSGGY